MTPRFRSVAVVGAGAVGSFFGAMLARAGHAVTLIGRPAHVQAIGRDGLSLEMAGQVDQVRLGASSDLAAVRGADLVLFCVKSTDTETVAAELAPLLEPDALLLSLQNGVDNAGRIMRHVAQRVIPAVVYVAAAMPGPGRVAHYGRGDLVVGAVGPGSDAEERALQDLVALFASAGVPVRVSADVMAELWSKLLVNCAFNAISGLAQLPYARLVALEPVRATQRAVVQELIAVAAADGVQLDLQASLDAVERIAAAMPAQLSSTAQDMARHKPSEIDHLNGFVAARGQALGVPTPVNQALYALVKLVESGYAATAPQR